jgi:cupin 2 domain-containing protein
MERGRLHDSTEAPTAGEAFHEIARMGRVVVEEILSGESHEPTPFLQAHDEWVVLLAGVAELDVDGERCELRPGDWVLLPAGVPHTVLRTDPSTQWLAVHLHAEV